MALRGLGFYHHHQALFQLGLRYSKFSWADVEFLYPPLCSFYLHPQRSTYRRRCWVQVFSTGCTEFLNPSRCLQKHL